MRHTVTFNVHCYSESPSIPSLAKQIIDITAAPNAQAPPSPRICADQVSGAVHVVTFLRKEEVEQTQNATQAISPVTPPNSPITPTATPPSVEVVMVDHEDLPTLTPGRIETVMEESGEHSKETCDTPDFSEYFGETPSVAELKPHRQKEILEDNVGSNGSDEVMEKEIELKGILRESPRKESKPEKKRRSWRRNSIGKNSPRFRKENPFSFRISPHGTEVNSLSPSPSPSAIRGDRRMSLESKCSAIQVATHSYLGDRDILSKSAPEKAAMANKQVNKHVTPEKILKFHTEACF